MVLSLLKYLGGYLRVRLSGYAPERFLNLCSNHNILIWNLEKCEDDYLFYISVKAFRQIKPFLRKTKTKVFILSKTGLPFYLHRYRKRKLFFAGILLAAAMLFLLSRFIWNVEIEGNSKVTDATLLQVLETYHCGYGTAKHTINCEEVERQLREDFPDIIWSSVRISGTKLTVTIKENLLMEQVESQSTYEYSDLIAAHDAVVDSIITRKGTPCVKVGDSVAAGDVLVSGRIDIMNDNGEVSAYEYCNCDADIYLIEVLDYEKSFPLLHEVQKKQATVKIGIPLFSLELNSLFLTGKNHMKTLRKAPNINSFYSIRIFMFQFPLEKSMMKNMKQNRNPIARKRQN